MQLFVSEDGLERSGGDHRKAAVPQTLTAHRSAWSKGGRVQADTVPSQVSSRSGEPLGCSLLRVRMPMLLKPILVKN